MPVQAYDTKDDADDDDDDNDDDHDDDDDDDDDCDHFRQLRLDAKHHCVNFRVSTPRQSCVLVCDSSSN